MPADIAEIIGNGILSRNTVGCSASAAYRVQGLAGGGNAYLKILEAVEDDDMRRDMHQPSSGFSTDSGKPVDNMNASQKAS